MEAALGVFAEKGLKRVTVDDLVGAAGFTRGAFYSNFTSIDEVFFAVFEQQSRRLLDAVSERIASIPDQEFSIEALVPVLDGLLPSSRTWYVVQAEFTLFALRSPEAQRVYAEHHRALQGEIEEMVAGIVERLGRQPVVPLPMLTETVVGLWLQALGQESLGIGALDTTSVTSTVLPHVLMGLSQPV